jgi:HAD superfamily hydrolase (TIGR01509 family)
VIRGIAFDLFDTLVDQNHARLAPVEVEGGRRVGATTPALHAFVRDEVGASMPLLEFADLQRAVDRELRGDTIDLGLELSSLDRFAALASRLGCSDVLAVAKALTETHMGMLHDAVTVPDHHAQILTALAIDYPLALCSNFSHGATARAVLRSTGIHDHLSTVVISDEVGIRKPRREIFDAVVDSLGMAPREILHVGDQLSADVSGAAAVGMRTVWLTRCVADPDRELEGYEGPPPDFALEDLADLPVLVARLNAS